MTDKEGRGLLDRVNQPADLLRFSIPELEELAAEIRARILEVLSEHPGHLSSNLGVVELSLALHYIFDSPRDKILWDVGHQCYTHKLVTGRRDAFKTLRTFGGLSGFPSPSESPHDTFMTGHAGTSISSAVGLALGRDLRGEKWRVVSVIGDGSLPNGMAMEAVNQAGAMKTDMVVVLNDNTMAISKTVGALSLYLNRIMSGAFYEKVRVRTRDFLLGFKKLGPQIARFAKLVEEEVKGMFGPGIIFEELGFRYLGPFDGNDLKGLINLFRQVRMMKGPILVHVVTKKGKGYSLAEKDPIKYYSPNPFNVETGEIIAKNGSPSYSEVFTDGLMGLAAEDSRVVAVTAAMLEGTMLKRFQEKFPGRIIDVGIAEEHAVTMAAGLAVAGLRPFVAIYSTFLQRSYDQVMHDVCLQNLPVSFALDRAGLVGEDGPTHHGLFDFAYLRHLPNMVVMAPSDANELVKMTATALRLNQPSSIRFPRGAAPALDPDSPLGPLPVGRGRLVREGEGAAILSIGTMLPCALEVASRLESEYGVKAAVVDSRFVKPLDSELIAGLAEKCGRIVTMEEHSAAGGFGSAVLEFLASKGIMVPVFTIALPDVFVEHGSTAKLKEKYGLAPRPAFEAVAGFLGLRAPSRETVR